MKHQLHKTVGDIFNDEILPAGCKISKDYACGGAQNIPLFYSAIKSRQNKFCDVDLLILKNGKIKVIFEIEEADIKPNQICGKFLTSALSSHYIHESENNKSIPMDDSVLFIQILDTSKLKTDMTAKIKQWKNIENSIKKIIPVKGSKIKDYKLYYGEVSDFKSEGKQRKILMDFVLKSLN